MSQPVTKPYFVHLITQQGESPSLLGFKGPEPVSKTPLVLSAGWGNKKGLPENKTMYASLKPTTFPMVPAVSNKIQPSYDVEYAAQTVYGPNIRY